MAVARVTGASLRQLIVERFVLAPVPGIPEIRLYTAGPSSGLGRLIGESGAAPYWAYAWSGGTALARHILDRPETVRGRRVLDLGAGGGVVAIAAAKAGAAAVTASELDPIGSAALQLNLEANGVEAVIAGDVTEAPPPPVDFIAGGDVFYAPEVAARVLPFLDRCLTAGIVVLVGDPGRKDLPRERLELLASYLVPEVGAKRSDALTPAAVYRLLALR
jgi:predicted nicotinamide N-methyase